MTAIELLQQIGLNKYEAEAYFTLLSDGPLTGYELGKRSRVPLSRSYEILERLAQRGLALVQPGDPPRYSASEPQQFLGQVRSTMSATLDDLTSALASLSRPDTSAEFWVLRGQQHILARTRALIASAQQSIYLELPRAEASSRPYSTELVDMLALARASGCRVFQSATIRGDTGSELVLLLIDGREALVGTLEPAERCQVVTSANKALVAALDGYFAQQMSPVHIISSGDAQQDEQLDWVAWENRKQRRLWRLSTSNRIA
jgi:HTH-type transcriptional regulator, sugar sensing transcriptional regulator